MESSYNNPTIAIMAEKLSPQIRKAIEEGQKFDESFIQNVIEKTFEKAIPEIEAEVAKKQEEMAAKKTGEKFLKAVFEQNGMELTGAFFNNQENLRALNSMISSFKGIDPNQEIDAQFIEKVKKEYPDAFAQITNTQKQLEAVQEGKLIEVSKPKTSHLLSMLSDGEKDGKNDPMDKTTSNHYRKSKFSQMASKSFVALE